MIDLEVTDEVAKFLLANDKKLQRKQNEWRPFSPYSQTQFTLICKTINKTPKKNFFKLLLFLQKYTNLIFICYNTTIGGLYDYIYR